MLVAFLLVAAGGILAILYDPFGNLGYTLLERITVAALSSLLPLGSMIVAVVLAGSRRFTSAADMDGAVGLGSTPRMRIISAIVRNTFEQGVLAIGIYFVAAILLPSFLLDAIAMSALAFVIGRVSFALGYRHGAAGRSIGIGLTFLPTALLFLAAFLSAAQ